MQANFVFEVTEWRKNKSKSTLHKGARLFKRMQTQIENDKLNGDMKYRNERERETKERQKKASDLVWRQQQQKNCMLEKLYVYYIW